MDATAHDLLNLSNEELETLIELLESERTRMLVGIRHAEHRAFRNELRQRLAVVERLVERFGSFAGRAPASPEAGV